jgi:hypothetical protein
LVSPPSPPGIGEAAPLIPGEDLERRFPAVSPPLAAGFPPDEDLWLVPWLPEGWYAASVRAVDAFGRRSTWLDSAPVLADAPVAPPPPTNVVAHLLQTSDPDLTADERALVAAHGEGCIAVSWDWPDHLRRQAPRAATFRVYAKRRPFNRLWVRVLSAATGPGPSELTCVIESDDAPPAGALAGCSLIDHATVAYRITANTAGSPCALTLRCHIDTSLLPVTGDGVLSILPETPLFEQPTTTAAWEGRLAQVELTAEEHYEAVIAPIDIVPTRGQPVKHARIGVATADASSRFTDAFVQPAGPPWDPALSGLPGREGGVTPPASIVAVLRELLAPVPAPVRDRLFTSPPDFYGRAYYELRWPHVTASQRSHTGWKVFRATDRAVFSLYHPDPLQSRIDVSGLSQAARDEVDAAFAENRADHISDEVIERLAGVPGADRAFIAATEQVLLNSADQMAFSDAVDGKNQVRYLYRLRAEDLAGNLSPLGPAMQAVHVPNTYPPRPVEVNECRGGEHQVVLEWLPNYEADFAGYLVFSTEDGLELDALEDLRLLRRPTGPETGEVEAYDRTGNLVAPSAVVSRAAADALLGDGRITLTREGLPGGRLFHYRLAAFDTAGNASSLSRVYAARSIGIDRPPPPVWDVPVLQANGLHLSWQAPTTDLNCLLQRSLDSQTWDNVGGWLGRGNYQTVDSGYQPGLLSHYRLRVMQQNGQINRDFDVLDV